MATNPEMLDSDIDSELLNVKNNLSFLSKEIKETAVDKVQLKVTKEPYEQNGAIIFKFEANGESGTRSFQVVTRKEGNKYNVRVNEYLFIKELGHNGWKNISETQIEARSELKFNRGLGDILNSIIGKNRETMPETGKTVYNMLNNKQNDEQVENLEMPTGLRLENGVYVYRVQQRDTRSELIGKLSEYGPLSYLKDGYSWSSDGANGFNVGNWLPSDAFDVGVDIIVPNKEYIKNVRDFKKTQLTAIENMKKNSKYGEKVKKLFESKKKGGYGYSEETVANALTAYARSESSRLARNENVGECALFRYEPTQVFSYGYHHVALSFKNGKSTKNLAGDKAFNSLNLKIGDTCDPVKSGMLCLAYMIEKNSGEYSKFFDIENNLQWCCDRYNGNGRESYNPDYDKKLKNNYNNIKNLK